MKRLCLTGGGLVPNELLADVRRWLCSNGNSLTDDPESSEVVVCLTLLAEDGRTSLLPQVQHWLSCGKKVVLFACGSDELIMKATYDEGMPRNLKVDDIYRLRNPSLQPAMLSQIGEAFHSVS